MRVSLLITLYSFSAVLSYGERCDVGQAYNLQIGGTISFKWYNLTSDIKNIVNYDNRRVNSYIMHISTCQQRQIVAKLIILANYDQVLYCSQTAYCVNNKAVYVLYFDKYINQTTLWNGPEQNRWQLIFWQALLIVLTRLHFTSLQPLATV